MRSADDTNKDRSHLSRRSLLRRAAGVAAAGALGVSAGSACNLTSAGAEGPVATKGRVNQSLVWWCYKKYWSLDEMCVVAKRLGCKSIELIGPDKWPTLKKHGLACAITGSHGFTKGMNNPANWDMCIGKIRTAIDACADNGFKNVISFTGFADGIPADVGLENCVKGFKKIVGHAEARKVNICLEMLNSRATENMKGHPGYQGDHIDYCMEILKRVGSERLKLLFDIYHVQIMDGDVINRVRECGDAIGHVHTAGNPGRGELDMKQEINYPPILEALVDIGYKGYVGQEFIPTRDAMEGLTEAVKLCDV